VIIAWVVALGLAARAGEYEVHKSQAELYARRGFYSDARDELALAMATPEGQRDASLAWAAAQVAWELQDVGAAIALGRRAASLAADDETRDTAASWATTLEDTFGFLTIEAPYAGMATRIQLDVSSTVFDPELKRYLNKLSISLRISTDLPTRVAVPAGDYLVNGEPVGVAAREESRVVLPVRAMGSRGLAAVQVARVEIAAGVSAPFSGRAANALPSPEIEIGITEPVGTLTAGVSVAMVAQAYRADGAVARSLGGGSIAARVGRELVLQGPVSLRPSALVRAGWLPGVPYRCDGAGVTWDCAPARDAGALSSEVYATARVLGIGGELLFEYRQAGRTTSLGTGVRLGVEELFGSVPSQSDAVLPDGTPVAWTATDRDVQVTAVRMLGQVAVVF
jgi:hypothetical protein